MVVVDGRADDEDACADGSSSWRSTSSEESYPALRFIQRFAREWRSVACVERGIIVEDGRWAKRGGVLSARGVVCGRERRADPSDGLVCRLQALNLLSGTHLRDYLVASLVVW